LTEQQKDVEEHIELTVELVHIYHLKLTFKCGLLKKQLMLKDKVKQDKSQKEKFQLDKLNEMIQILFKHQIFFRFIK
jgi:hypothetical protein